MATYTIAPWLTGKNISVCSIEPLTYDSTTGTLTSTSAQSIVGFIDELSVSGQQSTETVAPITSGYETEVATELNFSVTLSEVLRTTATGSFLAIAWQTGDEYARVIIARGGNTWTFIGLMTGYNESIRKGKCVAKLSLASVDMSNDAPSLGYS
jgi:hypothetical protein